MSAAASSTNADSSRVRQELDLTGATSRHLNLKFTADRVIDLLCPPTPLPPSLIVTNNEPSEEHFDLFSVLALLLPLTFSLEASAEDAHVLPSWMSRLETVCSSDPTVSSKPADENTDVTWPQRHAPFYLPSVSVLQTAWITALL